MKFIFSILLLFSFSCFAQDGDKRGTIKIEKTDCIKVKDNDSVYSTVDVMPQFPCGIDSLNKWLFKNLRYPQTELNNSIEGTVFLSFVVGLDGNISDITIFRGTNVSFDNEAMRLIKSMPKWFPGKCNGTIVAVKMNFPIKFSLQ
jgi:protein TonB